MQHPEQIEAESKRNWSYKGVFDDLKPIFKGADVIIGNLETTFSGYTGVPEYRSGTFTAPDEFAVALKNAGFTHLTLLNNHTFDEGYSGFERTKKIVKNAGIQPIFGHTFSQTETIEFLNFTTHSNKKIPDKKYTNYKIDKTLDSLSIAIPHWGAQYNPVATPEQIRIGDYLIDDWHVIGSGPHSVNKVIQDSKILAYSLGDFLSDHQKPNTTDVGKILKVTFKNNKPIKFQEWNSKTITTNGISKITIK